MASATCPSCGKALKSGAVLCVECGFDLDQFTRLQDKLRRLKQMDANLSFFGAEQHRYELNPPVAWYVIPEFEREYGVTLPVEYSTFLLRVGDGGAGPYYGLYRFEDANLPGDIRKPFPLERRWNKYGEPEQRYDLPAGVDVQDGCITLSQHGCCYYSFLVVTGKERGKIWDDFTAGDGGLHPTGKNFLEWYEWWLDIGLRREMWF